MADNSSNNSSGPRNWRDRVGVKGDMPRLADEFKTEPHASAKPAPAQRPLAAKPAAKPAARPVTKSAPQTVSRPAPMAPRRPSAAPGAAAPRRPVATPPSGDGSAERSNAFAERLRAQREAAETLAKKRSRETRNRLANAAKTGSGPRFSFADEEIQAATGETGKIGETGGRAAPQVAPPRPTPPRSVPPHTSVPANSQRPAYRPSQPAALAPPQAPQAPQAYQPSDAYRQTHGYREYDDAPVQPAPVPPGAQAAQAAQANQRYNEPDQRGYTPPATRGGYQPPPSGDGYYDDDAADDLFDDGTQALRPARTRAGASDYAAAYRDYDEAFDYDEEPRGRGGLWVFVVLMLVVVAAIAAGAYWFINYGTKIGLNAPTGGNVPTVTAPQQPVKVAPQPVDNAAPGAPVRRKKIYDRILGNETLEPEKLVPSEETPRLPPLPAIVPNGAPAAPTAPVVPPVGDAPLGVQPLPLPLPPPPTIPGVQGSIEGGVPGAITGKTNRVANLTPRAGKTGQTIIAPTATQKTSSARNTGGQQAPLTLPPTAPQLSSTQIPQTSPVPQASQVPQASKVPQASQVPQIPQTSQAPQAGPPAPTSSAVATPPLPRRKPADLIARARQTEEQRRLAALAGAAAQPQPAFPSAVPSAVPLAVPVAPRQPLAGSGPVQLSSGSSGAQNFNTQAAPAVPHQPNRNVASLSQPQLPASRPVATPQQPAVSGGGYVLQMSTFRDRNAASAEYRRLISRHASILAGLSPEIKEGDLGTSGKFYKLRLGSVASRGQAAQLCNALIAAGEKDCLVRNR